MKHLPVHWYQGLFVRPHHFQAADRYWSELIHTAHNWGHPFHYGLRVFDYDRDSLTAGELRVTRLEAMLRDGTLVSLDSGEELSIAVQEHLDEDPLTVYLGVPQLNPGGHNVGEIAANGAMRFVRLQRTTRDDTGWSAEQEIEFRRLHVELLPSRKNGYELLEVARIQRAGGVATHPVMDEAFIPPILSLEAWPELLSSVKGICSLVQQRMAARAGDTRQMDLDRIDASEAPLILLLDRYNEAYTALRLLTGGSRSHPAGRGIHPFDVYRELARILARLSVLHPQRQAVEVLPYDHNDLGTVFQDLCDKVRRHLDPPLARIKREPFVGDGCTMMVSLPSHWFDPGWQWYLGIDRGVEGQLTEAMLVDSLDKGEWYWVFGSRDQVERNLAQKQPGVRRQLVTSSVAGLPSRDDWTFFDLVQDELQSPAWREIKRTQTLAICFSGHAEDLTGIRHLSHRRPDGTAMRLKLTLFGVPSGPTS